MGEVLIPYIWAATGLVMLVGIVLAIFWAYQHGQFSEDIKEQMFTPGDDGPVRRLIRPAPRADVRSGERIDREASRSGGATRQRPQRGG